MSFLSWVLVGIIFASLALILLNKKGYPAVGLLYIFGIGSGVLAGWWATQLGWEWGNAINFNYRSIGVAAVANVMVMPIVLIVLNFLYPAAHADDPFMQQEIARNKKAAQ